MVILDADKAAQFHLASDTVFQRIDILGILLDLLGVLGDLLLQDVDFVGVFCVQFFQDRLIAEVAAAFLHGFGDDTGDFVTGHGTAPFKGAVAHAFDDTFFSQVVQGFIRPVVFGDIGEAVSR